MDEILRQFLIFYEQYPKKADKQRAFAAFRAALAGHPGSKTKLAEPPASLADILLGLAYYRFHPDPELIPYPATWLNNRRWITADITPAATVVTPVSRSSWRDKYDQPVVSDVQRAAPADWRPASARRPITIQGEIFGDD